MSGETLRIQTNVRVVIEHSLRHTAGQGHDGLIAGSAFRQDTYGAMPKVMEPETFELCLLGQTPPCATPTLHGFR
jgi:hypothetical protein